MYLDQLRLQGFRSAADTTVSFQPDVTVIVGENNAGKSNVMDAIRLLTPPLDGKGSGLYPDRDDLHRDGCPEDGHAEGCRKTIELSARYRSRSPGDLDMFSQAFDRDGESASYHLTITPPPEGFRRATLSWRAGEGATADLDPEPRAREGIRHLYLPPLRDAQRELASSSGGRIQLASRDCSRTTQTARSSSARSANSSRRSARSRRCPMPWTPSATVSPGSLRALCRSRLTSGSPTPPSAPSRGDFDSAWSRPDLTPVIWPNQGSDTPTCCSWLRC
ncbi:ATP-dependent endonuclease [Streptomyces albidoflavus]